MKVRIKIALLLAFVVATFAGGLAAIRAYDQRKFKSVLEQYEQDRRKSFDSFFERWTRPIASLANDYSCWDAMVAALTSQDRAWAEANLDDGTLAMSRANAIWVYGKDGKLFYSHNNLFSDALKEVPLPSDEMATIFAQQKFCHFYAETPLGFFEIRGATIHPSRDGARVTPHHGYLFVGHFWSQEDLKDISALTGHQVNLVPIADTTYRPDNDPVGVVTFTRPLSGWDGRPLIKLAVRNKSPSLQQLHGSSQRQFLWLILFAAVVFVVLLVALRSWVDRPIRSLSKCLRTRSPAPVKWLEKDPCEFGDFARLILEFFRQRESLIHEITERHETEKALHESEERLRHSQKMEAVGRLAGGIAHDFNNLLTAIIGYAELIIDRTQPGDSSHDEAVQIARAGEQAASLTRQLLAFSRKQILQPRVIDLNTLVREMHRLLQRVIGEHIELRLDTAAEEARLRADPHQVEQVILNLGVNARDAMPGGGTLLIATANLKLDQPLVDGTFSVEPGRYVTLTVQDGGCGMDESTRERIFEPFFTTKGPGKGTGLGLATVYGIVQQSGAAIAVRSSPGTGTAFIIYFPVVFEPVDAPQPKLPVETHSRDSETVLVVEDDEIVRELVCAVLTEQGYTVLCAGDGSSGLQLAAEHDGRIHLVVTDIIMPQMNGPEFVRELHLTRPDTKALYVSGYSDSDISDQGILDPGIQFLEKPFNPETLCRKVREVLDAEVGAVMA